ncbi:Oidioi.mRNA.OKI2018_I69.XSR.g15545.t1.cds [Oikopleura dioica]|uniref:Acyl carrier protein n=1 Tax=Oikopleura dioica TaxID=34765 RepID=A0ABN7SH63_OIKDI|nr:Oidioi.mRNA.OKI2018_I69.XSR.g15545.t1.cds [Oikopleura dioica]
MFKVVRTAARGLSVSARASMLSRQAVVAQIPKVSVRFVSPMATSIQEVSDRVFYVLSCFDKIDQSKLSLDSRFDKDLGLDSLDTTEICLQIEEEFILEISVEQADYLLTPREMIDYICDRLDIIH